ncbi:hypothetical protein ANCCAN_14052 [Ancylostoma caninum]|uniref:Uncharacterized protein n=1 Tax=Ancylostoma caninum TaxID=29170 RepID=A0A368G9Q5_ANCCA|nr:hypothetical protein ANCCAN_14052 [Ancylostoma caninum]
MYPAVCSEQGSCNIQNEVKKQPYELSSLKTSSDPRQCFLLSVDDSYDSYSWMYIPGISNDSSAASPT